MYIWQNRQIKTLDEKLESAKDDIYDKFGKILEKTSEDMTVIKTDVGKQTEAIRSVCKTLDNVQKDIRQMREIR